MQAFACCRRPTVLFPVLGVLSALIGAGAGAARAEGVEYRSGIEWQEPAIVTPGAVPGAPPSDAIVLFDGSDTSAWRNGENWLVENGELVVGKGAIRTKRHFGDCQLHLEWSAPTPATGRGQGRGNSGVFFMNFGWGSRGHEIQVLDSYKNKTYFDGQAGAIYKQTPPMVNPIRPPGEWNVYDLFWTAPKFDGEGELVSPAYMTAVFNGVLVLNHFELLGGTPFDKPPSYTFNGRYGPIGLQDHGNPVRYRNLWVRELKPPAGKRVREPYFVDLDSKKEWPVSGAKPPIRRDAKESP